MSGQQTVYQYRYYCLTESNFKTVWSPQPPTSCTTDIADIIDLSSITIVDSISQNTVIIQNDPKNTGGNYMLKGITFTVPAQSNYVFSSSCPVPISCLNVYCYPNDSNVNDMISVYTKLPHLPLESNVDVGASNIWINPQVVDYIKKGYVVSLSNANSCDYLDVITDIMGNKITTVNASSNAYMVGNSMFDTKVYFAKNLVMPIAKTYTIGKGTLNGTYVPRDTNIYIDYTNNNTQQKDFTVHVEYTY
jgi:hypothetical protein